MLSDILSRFHNELKALVKIGAELEFYTNPELTLTQIKDILGEESIFAESGENQFEIKLGPSIEIDTFIKKLVLLQNKLLNNNLFNNSPKPFPDQPSSGLHIHINLLSLDGKKNLYEKEGNDESKLLLYSISGLLKNIKKDLKIFAPSEEAMQRYLAGMNNPTKICWGGNNRTTALRIPPPESGDRRIEHRVPSSDCQIEEATRAILEAIYHGIKEENLPPEKIHGNAFLDIYKAEKIISEDC